MLAAPQRPKPQPQEAPGFDANYLADDTLDPSVRADAASNAMQDETGDRAFQAQRTVGMPGGASIHEVNALSNMLGGLQKDQAAGPLAKQQKEVDALRADDLDAITQGFTGDQAIEQHPNGSFTGGQAMSPMQQREIYKRSQAEKNSPSALQASATEARQFEQGRTLNMTNRNTTAQMAPSMMYADLARQQYEDAKAGGNAGGNNIKAVGKNGIVYQNTPVTPGLNPTTLSTKLQDAQGALGKASPFQSWDNGSQEQQFFNRGVLNYLQTSKLDNQSKQTLLEVLKDPELSSLDSAQLKQIAIQQPGYDERDWQEFERLFNYFKGR